MKEEVVSRCKLTIADDNYEDIHMAVESILTERIGDAAKRIHTARSRNDQVALDMRMYVKDQIRDLIKIITALLDGLKSIGLEHLDTLMPGYTHMQKAQPITLAHHLSAYIEMLVRDRDRLRDVYKRTNTMPLGSGALACSTFDIDREFVADALGIFRRSRKTVLTPYRIEII